MKFRRGVDLSINKNLIDDADSGELVAVENGGVDLNCHAISPQVGVRMRVQVESVGDRL